MRAVPRSCTATSGWLGVRPSHSARHWPERPLPRGWRRKREKSCVFFAPTPRHSSVLGSLCPGCGLVSRRLRGVGDREVGPGRPRGPEEREAAPRARTAAARIVSGSPGGMTASHPRTWEPEAMRRSQELGLEVAEGSVLPRRTSPKRSAVRAAPEPGSCRTPHSPPGGAGTHRARPPPRWNELSTAALGAARGHSGNRGGKRPWGGKGADDGIVPL